MAQTRNADSPSRALVIGAIGIVFGDIGTSPLYTVQECFGAHGVAPTPDNVLGVVSLVVWAVTLVVTIKYVGFLMRVSNRGEGGILALLALLPTQRERRPGLYAVLALAGAALLFGDGIITPAISVLSALEGLEIATPRAHPLIVPLTIAILVGLFAVQRRGTGAIGGLFGPIMIVWFVTLFVLGVAAVARHPAALAALSPHHGARFLLAHGWTGFAIIGFVVLAVTGGEALYADMGHFGASAIRRAWLWLIFPSLLACYLGQAAVMLESPAAAARPFFFLVAPGIATVLLVAIATPATVIASQALVSGVFTLARQAVQLGYFPRLRIKHTSSATVGQIFVPFMNAVVAVGSIGLVVVFRESSRLAAAFGLAVSATMTITSILYFAVLRQTQPKRRVWPLVTLVFFLSFDVPFVAANLAKIVDGGWVPLAIAAVFLGIMLVWRHGRLLLVRHYRQKHVSVEQFLARLGGGHPLRETPIARSPGTAVVMASTPEGMPPILIHFARRVGVVPARIVLFTIANVEQPYVDSAERLAVADLGHGVWRIIARIGFMESPRVVELLELARPELPWLALDEVIYFLGHETFVAGDASWVRRLFEALFAAINRNARPASFYFRIPPERVVEVGAQIDL